jgi:hypothetical protein
LSEVAQVWADQCASVIYEHSSDSYPKIFHERGSERMTSQFNAPPGKTSFITNISVTYTSYMLHRVENLRIVKGIKKCYGMKDQTDGISDWSEW